MRSVAARWLWAAAFILAGMLFVSGRAAGEEDGNFFLRLVEDYEGFPDTAFNHVFLPYLGQGPTQTLTTFEPVSPTHSMFMTGRDSVTFDIDTSQYVPAGAGVWYRTNTPGYFRVVGDPDTFERAFTQDNAWHWVATDFDSTIDLGAIKYIEVAGIELQVDDMTAILVDKPCPDCETSEEMLACVVKFDGPTDEIIVQLPNGDTPTIEKCACYPAGTTITTGEATVIIEFCGTVDGRPIRNSIMSVRPVSETTFDRFLFTEDAAITRAWIKSGEVHVKVTEERVDYSTDMQTRTPNAVVSVRGTEFIAYAGCGPWSGVGVAEDTVRFRSLNPPYNWTDVPERKRVALGPTGSFVTSSTGYLVSSRASLQFGAVMPGSIRVMEMLLLNTYTEPLWISGYYTGGPDAAYFSVAGPPRSLGPGETMAIAVEYAPNASRNYAATLVVNSNDPLVPSHQYALTGTDPALDDCNSNGIPDAQDIASGQPDCNDNRIPDACDLASGQSRDINQNGIPDECDCHARGLIGDANMNGAPWKVSDATAITSYETNGTHGYACPDAVDSDGDCLISILDVQTILRVVVGDLPAFAGERLGCHPFEAPVMGDAGTVLQVGSPGLAIPIGVSSPVPLSLTNPDAITHFQIPLGITYGGTYTIDSVTVSNRIALKKSLWSYPGYLLFFNPTAPIAAGSGVIGYVWIKANSAGTLAYSLADPGTAAHLYTGLFCGNGIDVYAPGSTLIYNTSVGAPCYCPHQSDFDEDGFLTALDLSTMIDILFAGHPDEQDPICPAPRADFDCDGFSTALDLSGLIDHLFAGGAAPCDPCVTPPGK